jgi:tetratricopeptide (TPR) repeat protein
MAPVAVVTLVALILTLVRVAPAQAEDTTTAREHYQKGTSYYDLGRYQDAIKEFEAAYEIKNDPALLYNLAQSHRLAGNSDQALHFYRTYLRRFPKAPNRVEIEGRITALEQLVAQKSATQSTPPNQTLAPGNTTPPPGGTEATPPPPPPPSTNPPLATEPPLAGTGAPPPMVTTMPAPASSHPGKTLKLLGKIGAGVGGAAFLIGLAFGARAAGATNEVNNAAKAGGTFDPAVEARGKSSQQAEAAFLTLGILIGGVGAGLYFYGRHQEQAAARVSMTPVASANQAGAIVQVTF